jgi:hypothetical protein
MRTTAIQFSKRLMSDYSSQRVFETDQEDLEETCNGQLFLLASLIYAERT